MCSKKNRLAKGSSCLRIEFVWGRGFVIAACRYRLCATARQIIDIHVSAVDSLKLAQAQTPQKSLQVPQFRQQRAENSNEPSSEALH